MISTPLSSEALGELDFEQIAREWLYKNDLPIANAKYLANMLILLRNDIEEATSKRIAAWLRNDEPSPHYALMAGLADAIERGDWRR